jgi:hypothetical protein
MFSFLYHYQVLYRTWLYIWVTWRLSYKKKGLLTLRDHLSSPTFFLCMVHVALFLFAVVLLCVFTFWVPFLWCPLRFSQNTVRLYLWLCVGGPISYLRYLCLFAYSGVQHIMCCVFALFFFVLYYLCYQFLWIVRFWLPFRYSLAFISHPGVKSYLHVDCLSRNNYNYNVSLDVKLQFIK